MITKQCRVCLHLKENLPILACDAFPKGIPTIILKGEFDHTNEFEGDNGIRFERDFGNQQQNNNYSDKIKENSVYLDNVTSFIKLNYKCPKGTVDDSNKCDIEKPIVNIPIPNKFKDIDNVKSDKIRGESSEFLNQLVQNNEYLVNSLKSYTNIGHLEVNKYLGNRISGNIPKEIEKIIIGLDSIFNLQKEQNFLTSSSITTYRGVSDIEIENLLGLNQKHIYDIEPGKIITDPKFVSTTLNKEQALQFGRDRYGGSIITILIPKNSEALHTESVSGNEDELLINRNQSYKFLGVNKNIDNSGLDSNKPVHEFIFELVNANQKQSSSHLSDAVETIKLNYNCPDSEKNGTGPGSCGGNKPSDSLENFKLGDKPTKSRPTNPDRFVETKLSNNIVPELSNKIKSVVSNAYKNIPELNGTPLTTKNVSEKEYPELKNAFAAHDSNNIYLNDKYFSDISKMEQKLSKEVESGFHPKGCNTAESIITHELGHLLFDGMAIRGDEKWDKISDVIQESKESGELGKVSKYALSEAGNGKLSEAASEIFASIFHTKEEEQEPVVKKVKDILFGNSSNIQITKVHRDVPGLSWLEEDRAYAKERSVKTGKPITGTVTASIESDFKKLMSDESGWGNSKENIYGYVPDVPGTTYGVTYIGRPIKTKQDSSYLEDVTNFIKLNYKCKAGTVDDSNKCGLEQNTTSLTDRYDDKNTSSNVIAGYVRNDNKLVNSILSGDYDLSEKDKNRGLEKIRLLDNIFKDKLLPEKEITYRGISKSNIKNLPDNWNKIGNVISPGTFLSTSRSRSEAEGFITGGSNDDSILIKLILPRNTNAINVSDFVPKTSAYAYSFDENEVLVDRNTEFKVVDYRIENSRNMGELHIATWEAIPDEQKQNTAYLADAFETIKLNYKCPKGTVDDSNKCNPEEQEKSNTSDSKHTSETFIGFKADHDFSSKKSEILKTPRAKLVSLIDPELDNKLNNLSKQAKTLSKSEKHILSEYSLNEYININEFLTKKIEKNIPNPEELDILYEDAILEQAKENVEKLDNIFKNVSLPENIVSYRGLRDDILVENRELMEALDTPGSEVSFDCFSSSSVMPFVASNFATGYNGRLIELRLPKGSKALYIAEVSMSPSEYELLINRGTKFKVLESKTVEIMNPYKENNDKTKFKVTTLQAIV